jgi:hypothetical protein
VPAKPAAKAALQSHRGEAEEVLVPVGSWYLHSGTFTVHAAHPLKFKTGFHKVSYFAGDEEPMSIRDTAGLERLSDNIHTFTFVADETTHPMGY